ncbi:MAG: T9SS type A sorting domain-containing protein [Saprospiraceae bacterium]
MKEFKNLGLFLFISILYGPLNATTLEVGPGKTYATPTQAAQIAQPGDTILIFPNTYAGGNFIGNLHGHESAFIYFIGVDVETVIFQGGSQAFHFSEVSYIQIENISVTGQTGNGVNIDDGGTFDSPSHHIKVIGCRFYDMAAQGNNDFLKLSGIDSFLIERCFFNHGALGGSGIDMVGCHFGVITNNQFDDLGSNCIQAKGGSQFVTIKANYFVNGGQRSLNLGGSTGLAFFRPQNATFEAADLDVYANVFVGSWAPIAFVGCVRVHVVNNTIIFPENWVIRILQETVDPSRFLLCGDNSFVNNIIYLNHTLSRQVNIGSNTASNTFLFQHNLWYNVANPTNSTPQLPVQEAGAKVGLDPLFVDANDQNFRLQPSSPAVDAGILTAYHQDILGQFIPIGPFMDMGAYEFDYNTTPSSEMEKRLDVKITPNPFQSTIRIDFAENIPLSIKIWDIQGKLLYISKEWDHSKPKEINVSFLSPGIYILGANQSVVTIYKSN